VVKGTNLKFSRVLKLFNFLKASESVPVSYARQVQISNILAVFFFLVGIVTLLLFYYASGWFSSLGFLLIAALLFLAVPLLNRLGSSRAGRMLFCLLPVWFTLFITIYFKLVDHRITYIAYFDTRFLLMATPILPGLVFRLEEKWPLFICLGSSIICVFFYDVIHQFFGAGYYQQGFTERTYYFVSYMSAVAFLVLVTGILLLRSVMEKSEAILETQNKVLQQKQLEVEIEHEEMLAQKEKVISSSIKLEEANAVIVKQREALEKYNSRLEAIVAKKSEELRRTNEELIKHNNELLQFSYTVSHNLRGPVARLLGLSRLFKVSDKPEEKIHIEDLVIRSSQELDSILKDLSMIIDIRNEIYRVREKVYLAEEWKRAIIMLGENVKPEYIFDVDFQAAPFIFGVRPMIHSILFNLLSNAIKYQSPDRPLVVRIHSHALSSVKTMVEIRDNGLGIDLKNQNHNIFKLYKRFHSHVQGKGLGLYLVKTQVEALGGKIVVQSELNVGTTFSIVFVQPEEVSRQVFHENDAVQLYYDGNLKITVIVWKRNVTSKEYRETFTIVLDSLKIYRTPGWISDLRQQGDISDEDQKWLFRTLAQEAVKSGLRQIAIIGFNEEAKAKYFDRIKRVTTENAVGLGLFDNMEDALQWMRESFNVDSI
jgi:signal transduction histidine kinase